MVTSLMVSTTRGHEFAIASVSVKKVFSDSSFKLVLCVFRIDKIIVWAGLICLSHTPPIWLSKGGFIFHRIQSAFCFSGNSLISLWFISVIHFANSFLAPTKFPQLSHQIDLTFPLLTMNHLNARLSPNYSFFQHGWLDKPNMWKVHHIVSGLFSSPWFQTDRTCSHHSKWMAALLLFYLVVNQPLFVHQFFLSIFDK